MTGESFSKSPRKARNPPEPIIVIERRVVVEVVTEGNVAAQYSHPVEVALAAIGSLAFVSPREVNVGISVTDSLEFVFDHHRFKVTIEPNYTEG